MDEGTHLQAADVADACVKMVGRVQLVALGPGGQERVLVLDRRGPDHRATDIANAAGGGGALGQKLDAAGRLTWEQYEPIARLRGYVDGLNDEPGELDVW